jgi:hypothetical protein
MDIDWTSDEWIDDDDDAGLNTLPPGEEGMFHSHAGETIFEQIMEDIDPEYVHTPQHNLLIPSVSLAI